MNSQCGTQGDVWKCKCFTCLTRLCYEIWEEFNVKRDAKSVTLICIHIVWILPLIILATSTWQNPSLQLHIAPTKMTPKLALFKKSIKRDPSSLEQSRISMNGTTGIYIHLPLPENKIFKTLSIQNMSLTTLMMSTSFKRSKGQEFVRFSEATSDALKLFCDIVELFTTSTNADIKATEILNFLTDFKLG